MSEGSFGKHRELLEHVIVPASLLCYTGDKKRGQELIRRTWHRLVVDLQMAWDMPQGLDPEGNYRSGLEYYHNTMLWSFLPFLFGLSLRQFCAPGELYTIA